MKVADIQLIAIARGMSPGRMTKSELVRSLQTEEGNTACFQSGQVGSCGQDSCWWREDCK
jgi:hypothetical protein